MLPMSRSKHEGEPNPLYTANSAASSEPWWRNKGCNSFSSVTMQGNASDSSSLEQSLDGKLRSEGGISEKDDDTSKQSPSTIQKFSAGGYESPTSRAYHSSQLWNLIQPYDSSNFAIHLDLVHTLMIRIMDE